MEQRNFYNEILTEHNANPYHKHPLADATVSQEGVNPTCGDEVTLHLKVENGVIVKGGFEGYGCAISQASTDIMLDLVLGKTVEEAKTLSDLFFRMIQGEITQEELEELEDGSAFQDIAHMPARVKCAVLAWHTMKLMLEED